MKLFFLTIPAAQIFLSAVTYYAMAMGFGMKDQFTTKFNFISEYQLGYGFLAIWIVSLARSRLAVNANAQRAGARVDRPDQHIYKLMDQNAPPGAPYVLMANTGAAGRFNRGTLDTPVNFSAFRSVSFARSLALRFFKLSIILF